MKGFVVIGALIVANSGIEKNAEKAIDAARTLRKLLSCEDEEVLGAVADLGTGDVRFFSSKPVNSKSLESVSTVVYDDYPEKYVWERGCLLRCELPIRLPIYYPVNNPCGKFISGARFFGRKSVIGFGI